MLQKVLFNDKLAEYLPEIVFIFEDWPIKVPYVNRFGATFFKMLCATIMIYEALHEEFRKIFSGYISLEASESLYNKVLALQELEIGKHSSVIEHLLPQLRLHIARDKMFYVIFRRRKHDEFAKRVWRQYLSSEMYQSLMRAFMELFVDNQSERVLITKRIWRRQNEIYSNSNR